MNIAIISAGGSGQRMGQDIPKQFLTVNDKPIIIYTLEIFQNHPEIDEIYIACIKGWESVLSSYAAQFNITKLKKIVPGGETGPGSTLNAVDEIKKDHKDTDFLILHDSTRPTVSAEIISDVIAVCKKNGNAVSAIPSAEMVLISHDNRISSNESFPRQKLLRTQTPHCYTLSGLITIYNDSKKAGIFETSVAADHMLTQLGRTVYFSKGSERNIKLTTVADIEIFKALITTEKLGWLK